MHRRSISQQVFNETALELRHPQRHVREALSEIITGTHEHHGATVLMQDGDAYSAHVDEPAFLDRMTMMDARASAHAIA